MKLQRKIILSLCGIAMLNVSTIPQVFAINTHPKTAENMLLQEEKKKTVSGTVVDKNGEPIIGANIRLKRNKKIGATTNVDGKFTIANLLNSDVLIVSYIGFKPKNVKVGNKSDLKIILEMSEQTLEEVVVETGYQKINRRLFTGSASQLKGNDAKVDGVTDVSRMLQGKAAGVQVQNVSSTFGAAPKIRVRGASSIYGNQTPLWVVDGVVLEDVVEVSADDLSSGNAATLISSAVAGINADDIESFQILKDASATALYGARAMNGVVVITTKKGREGSAKVSYTGEFTLRQRPSYKDYNILNSAEQMDIYREMYYKGFLNFASTSRSENAGEFYVMSNLINTWDPKTQSFGMKNTFEEREAFLDAAARRNTDWFGELFNNTIQQNHAVSISGGTKKAQFYGSLSFFNDPGWTVADKVKRFTSNVNMGYRFSKTLSMKLLTNSSVRKQKVPGTQSRTFDNVSGQYSRDFDINPFSYALNTSRTMRARGADGSPFFYQRNYAPFSILNELNENYININMLESKFQAELHYNPFKELEVSAIGAVRYAKSTRESVVTERSNRAMAYRAAQDATIIQRNRYPRPRKLLPPSGFTCRRFL